MDKTGDFHKGNKIIEYGKVYEIYEVENLITNGVSEKILYYKPIFTTDYNNSLICSIPEKNIMTSNIRKPITKVKLDEIIGFLSTKTRSDITQIDLLMVEDVFRQNDIYETIRVIKQCVAKQKTTGEPFNFGKKGVLNSAIGLVQEEVAYVYELSLIEALEKLKSAANSYYSK